MNLEETLVSVWRQALVEGCQKVTLQERLKRHRAKGHNCAFSSMPGRQPIASERKVPYEGFPW